jgi:membrane-associated protease RseP (regulator of RpoE activity)
MGKLSKAWMLFAVPAVAAVFLGSAATSVGLAGDRSRSLAYTFHGPDRGAFLGVAVEEETEHPEGGARIESVVGDSPAEEAGLAEGDIIVGLDDRVIRGPRGLTKRLEEREPGDVVEVSVLRDGRERSFEIELGRRSGVWIGSGPALGLHAPEFGTLDCEDGDDCTFSFTWSCEDDECDDGIFDLGSLFLRRPMLGVQLVSVTDELREHLGGVEGRGILVSKIVSGSPAEDAGIEVGDLIVAVDGESVEDASDIRAALAGKAGETFDVELIRDRRPLSLAVTLPAREERATGPRAFYLQGARDLADATRTHARVLRSGAREARAEARLAAREAYREALRTSREARREAAREARDAVRRLRSI